MDKKAIAVAAGLMTLSWAALYPVYLLLKQNKKMKKELEKVRTNEVSEHLNVAQRSEE